MSMSGSWLMPSAASSAFSTSSRIVVYKHLPGCGRWDQSQQRTLGRSSIGKRQRAAHAAASQAARRAHVVKACDSAVVSEELRRALLLQQVALGCLWSHGCWPPAARAPPTGPRLCSRLLPPAASLARRCAALAPGSGLCRRPAAINGRRLSGWPKRSRWCVAGGLQCPGVRHPLSDTKSCQ